MGRRQEIGETIVNASKGVEFGGLRAAVARRDIALSSTTLPDE
jgi:hypothetical protein